jgi:multiple sugar transport system ATP-binding protein
MPRLVLEQLTKSFSGADGKPIPAAAGVSLTVAPGELLAVVGPSGCGKTTLLRLIAGLETPDAGRIFFADTDVTRQPPVARDVAMVFQSHALFPHFTARENIAFGLRLRGTAPAEQARRVMELVDVLGVSDCLERRPAELSGGERQRVALARALIREPKILLLDEPFGQLDAALRRQLQAELPGWRKRFRPTTVLVTHDQAEALALGDLVAVLDRGVVQQVGPPQEIYTRPANRFVATFIGTPPMNLWPGTIARRDGRLVFVSAPTGPMLPELMLSLDEVAASRFGNYVGRDILLGLRPEQIALIAIAAADNAAVVGTVESARYIGSETIYDVTLAGRKCVVRSPAEVKWEIGQRVAVQCNWSCAQIFDPTTGAVLGERG